MNEHDDLHLGKLKGQVMVFTLQLYSPNMSVFLGYTDFQKGRAGIYPVSLVYWVRCYSDRGLCRPLVMRTKVREKEIDQNVEYTKCLPVQGVLRTRASHQGCLLRIFDRGIGTENGTL